ncbi:autophagy protein 16 [Monosporozyma unispora]|nr:autophagy protein 16, interacts with Atg12p-Atg5p [Kazachstania unispora]
MSEKSLLERLEVRNAVEAHYKELFQDIITLDSNNITTSSNAQMNTIVEKYREELKSKDKDINRLQEILDVMNKNNERLNDEIISMTIENNVLEDKFNTLNEEHNKLVQRWLSKVQQDADAMNATIESRGSR